MGTARTSQLPRCVPPRTWKAIAGALVLLTAHAVQAQAAPSVLADPSSAWQPASPQRFAMSLQTQPTTPQFNTLQPRGGIIEAHPHAAQPAALNLDFRRKSAHQQAKDLLRVQLTADSVLNFRPRGGGLVVTYRAQF